MYITMLLLSLGLLLLAVAAMGIRMLLIRGAKFPQTHVGRNKEMAKRGITCAQSIDVGCHSTDDYPGCSTCGTIRDL